MEFKQHSNSWLERVIFPFTGTRFSATRSGTAPLVAKLQIGNGPRRDGLTVQLMLSFARKAIGCLAISIAINSFVSPEARSEEFALGLPVQCESSTGCIIQNYVDVDPSKSVSDYACGRASNNGHKGVDFRLLSILETMQAGVNVLAAAPGIVKSIRNNMVDRLLANEEDRRAVANRECGNGVLIDHNNGWQTQYCHMRRGSVRVRAGDKLERGDPIGLVGYSGFTQFPHVHLSVRHNGKMVDPFLGEGGKRIRNCGVGTNQLWLSGIRSKLGAPAPRIIESGFVTHPVTNTELERRRKAFTPAAKNKDLIAFVRVINLAKGDKVSIVLRGVNGLLTRYVTKPVNRAKSIYVAFTGKHPPAGNWPRGKYIAHFQVRRGNKPIATGSVSHIF